MSLDGLSIKSKYNKKLTSEIISLGFLEFSIY